MDIVQKRRTREWTLLSLVGAMALVANLPDTMLATVGLSAAWSWRCWAWSW